MTMHPLKVALKKIDEVSNRAAEEAARPVAIDVGAAPVVKV